MPAQKKIDGFGKLVWEDSNGQQYGLIVGGIGWPSVKPGHLVVGGVLAIEDPDLEGHEIRILAEGEEPDLSGLFDLSIKMKNSFCLDRLFAYPDPAFNRTIEFFKKDRANSGLNPLYFYETETKGEGDKILSILSLVKRLTRQSRKRLTFGPESTLPGYLVSISPEEAHSADVLDHPPIAALGACLGVLSKWRPRPYEKELRVEMAFDPHDPFASVGRRREPALETDFDIFNP